MSKNISGEKEAPANGNERKFIRDVFTDVSRRLKKEYNIDITMADLQAVLWYPEKILYESFKGGQTFEEASEGYTSESAPDYFNAAKKLATKLGINETEINQALSRGRERAQRGVGKTDTEIRESVSSADKEVLKRITETIGKPIVSKAQITEPKFIRDIGVLITPATVRGFDATTERIKKLSLKYDELVKQYAKTQSKSTGDEIKRIEGRILDNVREKLTNDISKIKGASVKFGPARIGLWDNKFEPSFNMTLSVSPELNSDEISNLLFDFGERYSQDAFILETDSELNDKYINGEISLFALCIFHSIPKNDMY